MQPVKSARAEATPVPRTGRVRAVWLPLLVASSVALAGRPAHAADPKTSECLAASEASIQSDTRHQLRAERGQLLVCSAATCPADIHKECLRRLEEVTAQIPTVVFAAKDGAGGDLVDVRVTMDGEVLATRLEGTPLSVDPGPHRFTFEAAGLPAVTRDLVLGQGERGRREAVTLGAPASSVAPAQRAGATPAVEAGAGGRTVAGMVTGGVGVVALGIGGALGLAALVKKGTASSECATNPCTGPHAAAGAADWNAAYDLGTAATVGVVVGAVALAGGLTLWLTAPKQSAVQVGVGPGSVVVSGAW